MAKTCNLTLIERKEGKAMYAMLNEIIASHCPDLADCTILLAWRANVKEDKDGKIELGYARKASELERELHPDPYDGVIVLNQESWGDMSDHQRQALLLHECLHFALVKEDDGSPSRDDKDRLILRMRKHDIEEFRRVVEVFGFYKRDLEAFAEACQKARENPLFESVAGTITPNPEAHAS